MRLVARRGAWFRAFPVALATVYSLFLVYGSLLPFEYQPITVGAAWERFEGIPYLQLGVGQERADWVATILLWFPAGFLWMGALTNASARWPWRLFTAMLVGVASVGYALAVEFAQIWFPPRTISQNDVLAAVSGGIVGAVAWLLVGDAVERGGRAIIGARDRRSRAEWLLGAYALALILYGLAPMDFVTSRDELWHKVQEGRCELIPFASVWEGRRSWHLPLVKLLAWIPAGVLAGGDWGHASKARRRVALALVAVAGVELTRVFVFSADSSTTNVLVAWVGLALGTALATCWPDWEPRILRSPEFQLLTARGWPWLLLTLAYLGLVVGWTWWSDDFLEDPQWTRPRLEAFLRPPFAAMYWNSKFGALRSVLSKMALFVPAGILVAQSVRVLPVGPYARRLLLLLGLAAVAAMALIVELIQVFQATHQADVTDVLLGVAGAWLGIELIHVLLGAARRGGELDRPPGSRRAGRSCWPAIVVYGLVIAAGGIGVERGVKRIRSSGVPVTWRSTEVATELPVERPPTATAPDLRQEASTDDMGAADASPSPASLGVFFAPAPTDPFAVPRFVPVDMAGVTSGLEVGGATGRDGEGHIWFGASMPGTSRGAARLYEYDPETGRVADRGDVDTALEQVGLRPSDATQGRIESRIVLGRDGHLYFASMPGRDAGAEGSGRAIGNSHLWRMRMPERRWEHLQSLPDQLIAVARGGDWIYVFGAARQTLYQFDIRTGGVAKVTVAAGDRPASTQLIGDHRGHAFVPRWRPAVDGSNDVRAVLVEFDSQLRERGQFEMPVFATASSEPRTGIVALQPLADLSIVLATEGGYLYRIAPRDSGPTQVEPLGWFHPLGACQIATLFTYSGDRYVCGIGRPTTRDAGLYEWLVFDLENGQSRAVPIPAHESIQQAMFVQGWITRDNHGSFYVSGGGAAASPSLLDADLGRAILAVGGDERDLAAVAAATNTPPTPLLYRIDIHSAP